MDDKFGGTDAGFGENQGKKDHDAAFFDFVFDVAGERLDVGAIMFVVGGDVEQAVVIGRFPQPFKGVQSGVDVDAAGVDGGIAVLIAYCADDGHVVMTAVAHLHRDHIANGKIGQGHGRLVN